MARHHQPSGLTSRYPWLAPSHLVDSIDHILIVVRQIRSPTAMLRRRTRLFDHDYGGARPTNLQRSALATDCGPNKPPMPNTAMRTTRLVCSSLQSCVDRLPSRPDQAPKGRLHRRHLRAGQRRNAMVVREVQRLPCPVALQAQVSNRSSLA